jgi:AAA+ superfamily predicted ATPase
MMELFHFYRHRHQGRLPEESGLAAQTPRQALPPPPPETPRRALPPPPSLPETPSGPYTSSEEHLWDELRRIDLLVRAQTVRWWLTIAASKPQKWWGMVCVTDAEVEAYLSAPFTLPHELPPEVEGVLADYWRAAETLAQAIRVRLEQTPPHIMLRLVRLRELFGLSLNSLARDIPLVCLLPELDGRYRRLFGYLQDDASRTRPMVELVLQILHPVAPHPAAGQAVFDAEAPLLAHHLLVMDREAQGDESLPLRAIRLDDRIVKYLLRSDAPDARLAGMMSQPTGSFGWDQLIIDPEQATRLQNLAAWWQQQRAGSGATLLLHGPHGSNRLAAARAMCSATDTPLLVADVGKALRAAAGWERIVDLSYREARLREAALYWSGCEVLLEQNQPAHYWDYLIAAAENFQGLTFLASQTMWDPTGRFHDTLFLRLEFPMPGYALRRRLWEAYLPPPEAFADPAPGPTILADLLANSFQLTAGQIVDAVTTAWGQAARRDPLQPRLTADDLREGCRRQSGRRLITFAQCIEPRTDLTFDDLILPASNIRQLRELQARIRHRSRVYSSLGFERRLTLGKGLIALFTGSSGTGKTLAAQLLAREQGVDLYKVDLSAVVSKWVGETEKNLRWVFTEAEDANAIIFFDEADALFGKRGEVKEAQDRWANMEVNYLLQRVEEYAGVVILASNLRQNIDEAFMRRIHVIVEFPFPDTRARLSILSGLFPPGIARPSATDLHALAERFKLSGGSFKNIVIDAAFRAMASNECTTPAITLRHLVAATAREYQKLGKPITKGDFGEAFYAWVEEDIL